MPANTQHSAFRRIMPAYAKIRAAVAGETAVKNGGTDYLPNPGSLSTEDYRIYLRKSEFPEMTGRVLDVLVGMVMRKDPKNDHPPAMQSMFDNITLHGESLIDLQEDGVTEVLTCNRWGV